MFIYLHVVVIDGTDILYRDSIDISVAVASPKGLVGPVIRGCNNMNYADLEKAIADMGNKVRIHIYICVSRMLADCVFCGHIVSVYNIYLLLYVGT